MTVRSSAGSTLEVSTSQPATYDYAGYEASSMNYQRIGEITDLGEFGREYVVITHNPIGTRATKKLKGSYNEGQMAMTLGLDTDDAGQIILKAAVSSDNDYSFRLITQNGDRYFFQAQVASFKVGVAGVDNITSATCNLEITSNSLGVGVVESLAA